MAKIQTAFRFESEMIQRIKEKAKSQKRSTNSYLEMIIERDLQGQKVKNVEINSFCGAVHLGSWCTGCDVINTCEAFKENQNT
jgi:hypothetical protein